MSTKNIPVEGFRVNHDPIRGRVASRYSIVLGNSSGPYIPELHPDHTPTALRRQDDHHDVTTTALYDANQIRIDDPCLSWQDRFRNALVVLASCVPDEALGIEIVDSFCAAAARKIERKDRDVDRAMRDFDRARRDDTETEIGGISYADAERHVNNLRDALDHWENIGQEAQRVFEQIALRQWQDRNGKAELANAGQAAKWEQAYRTMKIMQKTRIVFTGGNEHVDLIPDWLAATKRKVGDNLLVVCADTESGFDAAVREQCKAQGIECLPVGFKDAEAKSRHFDRARMIFNELVPHGLVVLGGKGVQSEYLNLARRHKIKHVAPVAPAAA